MPWPLRIFRHVAAAVPACVLFLLALGVMGPSQPTTAAPPARPADVCWNVIDASNPSAYEEFSDISLLSSGEAWAVGWQGSVSGPNQTQIQRWQGNAWQLVPSPNRGTYS